jgi:hypothetical protein
LDKRWAVDAAYELQKNKQLNRTLLGAALLKSDALESLTTKHRLQIEDELDAIEEKMAIKEENADWHSWTGEEDSSSSSGGGGGAGTGGTGDGRNSSNSSSSNSSNS